MKRLFFMLILFFIAVQLKAQTSEFISNTDVNELRGGAIISFEALIDSTADVLKSDAFSLDTYDDELSSSNPIYHHAANLHGGTTSTQKIKWSIYGAFQNVDSLYFWITDIGTADSSTNVISGSSDWGYKAPFYKLYIQGATGNVLTTGEFWFYLPRKDYY